MIFKNSYYNYAVKSVKICEQKLNDKYKKTERGSRR